MTYRLGRGLPAARAGGDGPIVRLRLVAALLVGLCVLGSGCARHTQPPSLARGSAAPSADAAAPASALLAEARKNIGVPYKFGGNSPETGFDCSGFVCWVYAKDGIKLPRTAREQLQFGRRVGRDELEPGDIVVFKGTRSRTGWHSGLYSGDGKFIHSPTRGKTVTETSLDDPYFARRFAGGSRIPRDGSAGELYAAYQQQQRQQATEKRRSGKKSAKKSALVAEADKKTANSAAKTGGTGKADKSPAPKSAAKAEAAPAPGKKTTPSGKNVRNKPAKSLKTAPKAAPAQDSRQAGASEKALRAGKTG